MTGRDIPSIKLKKVLETQSCSGRIIKSAVKTQSATAKITEQTDNTLIGFLVLAAVFVLILWGLPALYEFVMSFK